MFHSFTRFLCPFVLTAAHAVSAQTGTVEGRVKNAASGSFLNNVRVVVQGTAAEAATNESGEYRLANVPAGERILVAVFAGMETQSTLVNVAAGESPRRISRLRWPAHGRTALPSSSSV